MPQRHSRREEETAFISTPATSVLARLFPDSTILRFEACAIDDTMAQITLRVHSTQATVPCPLCATPARRIHSHYERTLADLPWAAYRMRLQLRVRKWFCGNRACRRRIFTERLPTVAAPWARRTLRGPTHMRLCWLSQRRVISTDTSVHFRGTWSRSFCVSSMACPNRFLQICDLTNRVT